MDTVPRFTLLATFLWRTGLFAAVSVILLAVSCAPSIPAPVMAAPAKADAETAVANPINVDPLLKPPFGPFDVQTAFYISKSNDKDRVDYGMRLDQYCAPTGSDAVFPYWRELEHAPPVRSHPLKFIQYLAYGLSEQQVVTAGKSGGQYRVKLKQVDRPVLVVTAKDEQRHCKSTAFTTIQGVANARLDHIFVQVAGSMSVDHVDIYGADPKTGAALFERLKR
ncbi:MAG TPA: DUF4833 domain-containing protein [Polyangiaceae bacterium]|nr:DUF4833 domain-containing protein [Polyangiaceae bacterium]